MKNKKILYAAVGVAALIVSAFVVINIRDDFNKNGTQISGGSNQPQKTSVYDNANLDLKQSLAAYNVSMSSPIKLKSSEDIGKYCSFFTNEDKQKLVQYCTSTELKDSNGNFLGNIHMVGSQDEPKIILVILQVDPFMSQINSVKTIISTTIQDLVCDCWDQEHPGNLQNVGEWVDGLKQFHLNGSKPHSQSNELVLNGKTMQLELTTNKDGYLWQFFIYK